MITWSIKNSRFFFSLPKERRDNISSIEVFKQHIDSESYLTFLLLNELVENGNANFENGDIVVNFDDMATLSSNEQRILGLPERFPYDIRIDADEDLGKDNFLFKWFFCSHVNGEPLIFKQNGPIIEVDKRTIYVLNEKQYALCKALDDYNNLGSEKKTLQFNLLKFSEIKNLAIEAKAYLHPYLENENIVNPTKIKLKLRNDGDDLEILPEVLVDDQEKFEQAFDKYPRERNVYSIEDKNGSRQRIVFDEDIKAELKKIKKYRRVHGEEKEKILERPNEVFDPNLIDLDLFSDRVVEIGLYKPRFYPFVSPYKSQWIPGVIIEKSPTEKTKIKFNKREDLERFKLVYGNSCKSKESQMEWEDSKIPLSEAKKIIIHSEKQFEDQTKPVDQSSDKERKVLIIIENVDELGYDQRMEYDEEFKHVFYNPPHIKGSVKLLEHQLEGVAWLESLNQRNIPGCLLADDMGLGKTLQVLSFIDWHNENKNFNKHSYLIIAPISLLENWQAEYKKFFSPTIPEMLELYGTNLISLNHLEQKEAVDWLSENKIFLSTYETLRGKHQFKLCAVDWAGVFLDEAQKVKTPGTLVTNAAKALKGEFKVSMTGTPVENSLMDLWCILDFCVPGLLGSGKEFSKTYHNPAKRDSEMLKTLGEELRAKIGIHIKRRLKTDVLKDLPKKIESKMKREMPFVQSERYEIEIANMKEGYSNFIDNRGMMLKFISTVKDISDHPFLPERDIDHYSIEDLINASAKLKLTEQLLVEIKHRNEKAIVFAERRETQRLLQRMLIEKFGVDASIINGDTPATAQKSTSSKLSRQGAIDKFQLKTGFNAIVMSPIATGIGLNITGANNIIHFSRHWNPAKEEQATDRAYRIGQEKDVNVYYPLAVSSNFKSFDLILDEHVSRKRTLASVSLFPTDQVEVDPFELFEDLLGGSGTGLESKVQTIEDLDKLNPYSFEAAIGAIYKKKYGSIYLTPRSNDKGADVIVLTPYENMLIQVKQTKTTVGDSAVGEILKAIGYYVQQFQKQFNSYIVTNGTLTNNAKILANSNNVVFIERNDLSTMIHEAGITLNDIVKCENSRQN